jgi:hypothetical protein|tara:strand:+ start:5984 stop:6634 length:651 start_codon:yes stop_codon:yes gene_type:complete
MDNSVISFSVHAGEADPLTPFIRFWDVNKGGIGKLYGVVEVLSGPAQDISEVVWEGVESSIKREPVLSVTGYLQEMVETSHKNLSAYAAREWAASLTLIAFQGDSFYIATAGPSFINLYEEGKIYDIPHASRDTLGTGVALGQPGNFIVHVAYQDFTQDNALLISWQGLKSLINSEELRTLFDRGAEIASRNLYRLINDESEFALLMVSKQDGGEG